MISTHTYAAVLLGSPNITLNVEGGKLSLDEGRAPHVQGDVTISMPQLSTLTALDPRLGKRVQVTATATFPFGTQTRTFNLGLRNRAVSHAAATVTLTLASDEAVLDDYAPLADDSSPFALASSLRSVVNYVLSKAGLPALSGTPSVDADLTPYWSVTNLVTNPQCDSTTGYVAASGTSAVGVSTSTPWQGTGSVVWNASGAVTAFLQVPVEATCRPGEVFTASAYVRANSGSTRVGRMLVRFINDGGGLVGDFTSPAVSIAVTSAWTRLTYAGVTAPAGATRVQLYMRQDANANGDQFAVDGVMLYKDPRVIPFFHGSSTGGGYNYTWGQGGVNASTSTRVPITERSPDSFTWPAGRSGLEFLRPLVQAAGYRLVCDETRVWTLRPAGFSAPGSLTVRHAVNLIDATDTLARDDLWFDAQVTVYRWTESGNQRTAVDAWALVTPPTRVNYVELADTPYPGPGRSQYAVQRAQGRGREVTVQTVADWTAAAEQPISIILDGAPTQIGATSRVTYDLDTDRMTIVTRTTDTPAGAINLLTGTINALAGSINSL